jgi:hypothetical protein
VNAGAMVSGGVWFDPVAKTGGASGYNTGYEIDLSSAVGCQDDATVGPDPNVDNANITTVLSGGGPSTLSLLGSSTPGLQFTMGS